MAVVKNLVSTSMQLQLQKGIDAEGNPQLTKVNYSDVKVNALEQDIYDVAVALSSLQQYTLFQVERLDQNQLVSQ